MTPEQSKKLWGRSAKGPERGYWVDTGNGNLVWRAHPKRRAATDVSRKTVELLEQGALT